MIEGSVVDLRNIRKKYLQYILIWILYYAWVIVFTSWWTSSPRTDAVYGDSIRSLLHSLNLLASAIIVMFVKRESFRLISSIGAICLILTSAVYFLNIEHVQLQLVIIIVFAVSLGLVNIGILIPFVFVLNNTEKFYAVLFANVLLTILVLFQEAGILNVTNGIWFSFIMLCIALVNILFFKSSCTQDSCPKKISLLPIDKNIFYITILINCLYAIFCKGIGRAYVSILSALLAINLNPVFYIGGLIGCVFYLLLYMLFRNSNHATWNVTFGTFVISMLMYSFSDSSIEMAYLFAFTAGIGSTMSMINMYYILGVIGKKYWSLWYVRFSILFIGICGGIAGIVSGRILEKAGTSASITVAIFSVFIIIVFFIFSPTLSDNYFKKEWAEDSKKEEVDNEKLYRFEKYKLSEREIQLCKLLLDGYTLRQSSAIMGVAYSTANTYCNSLYRKICINSRVELINTFKDNA